MLIIAVIVLGRGRNGFLYDHNNKLIEFHEIMSYFTPDRCTTLEGKPKLFLFQTVNDGTESKEIRFNTELTDSYQVLSFICIATFVYKTLIIIIQDILCSFLYILAVNFNINVHYSKYSLVD